MLVQFTLNADVNSSSYFRHDPGLPAGYRPVGSLKIAELLDRDLDELPALAARGAREPAT